MAKPPAPRPIICSDSRRDRVIGKLLLISSTYGAPLSRRHCHRVIVKELPANCELASVGDIRGRGSGAEPTQAQCAPKEIGLGILTVVRVLAGVMGREREAWVERDSA